jgi:hypothetical protein
LLDTRAGTASVRPSHTAPRPPVSAMPEKKRLAPRPRTRPGSARAGSSAYARAAPARCRLPPPRCRGGLPAPARCPPVVHSIGSPSVQSPRPPTAFWAALRNANPVPALIVLTSIDTSWPLKCSAPLPCASIASNWSQIAVATPQPRDPAARWRDWHRTIPVKPDQPRARHEDPLRSVVRVPPSPASDPCWCRT